jgi:hypothetical protein
LLHLVWPPFIRQLWSWPTTTSGAVIIRLLRYILFRDSDKIALKHEWYFHLQKVNHLYSHEDRSISHSKHLSTKSVTVLLLFGSVLSK